MSLNLLGNIFASREANFVSATMFPRVAGKQGNIVSYQCTFRHVSKSGQTLGNISEKHRETSNVSEFARKHFCFSGSKFCFRNNVFTGGQTEKHLRKHRESQMFPQQCFLVCPGLYLQLRAKLSYEDRIEIE